MSLAEWKKNKNEKWKHMNVTCVIRKDDIEIWRGSHHIGYVRADLNGEPFMHLFNEPKSSVSISFSDLNIIEDNWNQLMELIDKKSIDNGQEKGKV